MTVEQIVERCELELVLREHKLDDFDGAAGETGYCDEEGHGFGPLLSHGYRLARLRLRLDLAE